MVDKPATHHLHWGVCVLNSAPVGGRGKGFPKGEAWTEAAEKEQGRRQGGGGCSGEGGHCVQKKRVFRELLGAWWGCGAVEGTAEAEV